MAEERMPIGAAVVGVALVELLVAIAALTFALLFILPLINDSLEARRRFRRNLASLQRQTVGLINNPNRTRAECQALNADIQAFNNEFGEWLLEPLPLVDCSQTE